MSLYSRKKFISILFKSLGCHNGLPKKEIGAITGA